jgi:kumamolisin
MAWAAPALHSLLGRHVPAPELTRQLLGPVEDGRILHISMGLAGQNPEGALQRLAQAYDPQSPLYHHWLKPAEYGAQYGASPADYQAVLNWAVAHHLQVRGTYQSRLLVSLSGRAQDVAQAFHVRLLRYQHPAGGEFYAPDQEPSTELTVPLATISGLCDLGNRLRKRSSHRPAAARPAAGAGSWGTYLGADLRKVYLNSTSLNGTGQTIALVEFDNYYTTDIQDYATADGISSLPSITRVPVDEGAVQSPGSGEDEVALDIEMAMGIAPKASLLVYEVDQSALNYTVSPEVDILAKIADDDKAQSISCSWSWDPGSGVDGSTAQVMHQYALQGQSYFQAAGDMGAYDSYSPWTSGAAPQPIDDSSLMTVVGGTTLSTSGAPGSYLSETTWNTSPGVAATRTPNPPNAVASGGIVTLLAIPTWQVPFAQGQASTSKRNTPDVSLVADQLFWSYDNGHSDIAGGTSASAPLWAGIAALANQQAASQGQATIGFANPLLYTLANNSTSYANDFHDIADGSNNDYWGNHPTLYIAATGYDLATGLGSLKAPLVAGLAGLAPTFTSTPSPTSSRTPTKSPTPTASFSPTRTISPTFSASPTASATPTASPSFSASPTFSASPSITPSPAYRHSSAGQLLLAPVPVRQGGPLALYTDKPPAKSHWRIYDIAGELVVTLNFSGALASFSTQRLAPGIYLVQLDVEYADGSKRSALQKVAVTR